MTPYSSSMSALIRSRQTTLQPLLFADLESSIVGNNEVPFIKAFVPKLTATLTSALSGPGLSVTTRQVVVHAKPKVDYINVAGRKANCELADILFVVKYAQPSGGYEARYVFYQAKCAQHDKTTVCDIDQTQLELLRDWPTFEFGLKAHGGPVAHSITTTTNELGSYLLMQRRPVKGAMMVPSGPGTCYGWIAPAATIDKEGPLHVDCATIATYGCPDMILLEQIAFAYGEPDGNPNLKTLIDAVYRHVGLAPDPPDEFEGYYEEDGAFAVIEMVVSEGEFRG